MMSILTIRKQTRKPRKPNINEKYLIPDEVFGINTSAKNKTEQ